MKDKLKLNKRSFRIDDETWEKVENFSAPENNVSATLRHIIWDFFKGIGSTK